jgi:lipopolysaccharide biosynthesis regulator YciM
MAFIGKYAEKMGQFDQAELAFRSLSANAATARPAMEALLGIAEKRGDVELLCDTLKKMRARWPQDDSVKNDLAYVNLLMGRDVDESMAVAKELVARSPASLAHRTTLALAAIRKSDPAAALAVYHGLKIPWERVGQGHRAVHAAVLGANGQVAEAKAEAAALRWAELRAEERELVKSWRTQ